MTTETLTGNIKVNRQRSADSARRRVSDKCLQRLIDRRWIKGATIRPEGVDVPLKGLEVVHLTVSGRRKLATLRNDPDAFEKLWNPNTASPEFLPHHCLVNEAIVQILTQVRLNDWRTLGWLHDRQLKRINSLGRLGFGFVPDGLLFVEVQTPDGSRIVPLILEVDNGTEPIDSPAANSWRTKIEQIATFLKEVLPSHPDFIGSAHPLVLVIAPTDRRMHSIRAIAKKMGCRNAYWFSSMEQFAGNPLGSHWLFSYSNEEQSLEVALAGERIHPKRNGADTAESVTDMGAMKVEIENQTDIEAEKSIDEETRISGVFWINADGSVDEG